MALAALVSGNRGIMSVTIRDIAKEAGVSVAAVSRVLHGSGGTIRVSEQRAKHIQEVAARLNYVPNVVARNLRKGTSQNIGLVFENFGSISSGPLYYAYLFDGIASVLFANHYRLTILPEIDHKNVQGELSNGQLDGVIWCKFVEDPKVTRIIEKARIPVVTLNSPLSDGPKNSCSIQCDNESGMEQVVDHLYRLGHRKIGFVREQREEDTPDLIARLSGFRHSMLKRNLAFSDHDIFTWQFEATEFPTWWAKNRDYTALAVWNEGQASRILRRALDAGVDVPGQLSVVGFDSTDFCDSTVPPLTAVNQPIREMAQFAAKTLLSIISGEQPESQSVIFPCTLDVRGSTAALTQSRVS